MLFELKGKTVFPIVNGNRVKIYYTKDNPPTPEMPETWGDANNYKWQDLQLFTWGDFPQN